MNAQDEIALLEEVSYILTNDVLTAVGSRDLEELYSLEEEGCDLHFDNDRALFIAAKRGYIQIVEYLVEKGLTFKEEDLPTLLTSCSKNAHIDVLYYLVTESIVDIHSIDCIAHPDTKVWVDNYLLNQSLEQSLEVKNNHKQTKL